MLLIGWTTYEQLTWLCKGKQKELVLKWINFKKNYNNLNSVIVLFRLFFWWHHKNKSMRYYVLATDYDGTRQAINLLYQIHWQSGKADSNTVVGKSKSARWLVRKKGFGTTCSIVKKVSQNNFQFGITVWFKKTLYWMTIRIYDIFLLLYLLLETKKAWFVISLRLSAAFVS